MKKSQMNELNLKTSQVQRLLRARHKECIFAGNEVIIEFDKQDKRRKEPDLVVKCKDCKHGVPYDLGEWII